MALGARADSSLDRVSFADWLDANRLRSPAMRWYAEYGTRDDYGALARDTSAWAGVHYYASREPTEQGPLTWPEGNAWIARRLAAKVRDRTITGSPVHRILSNGRNGWSVRAGDAEYRCEDVIFAAPTFLAPYVIEGARAPGFAYSPWLVANLTLDRWPDERGVPPCVGQRPALTARDSDMWSQRINRYARTTGVLRYGRTIARSPTAILPRNGGCCLDPTGRSGWNES